MNKRWKLYSSLPGVLDVYLGAFDDQELEDFIAAHPELNKQYLVVESVKTWKTYPYTGLQDEGRCL